MFSHRHRFWEDADGLRLVRDSRGRFYYEREVPLGHHGGASPSVSPGTSWTYTPTVSPSPPPRHRRRRRHRRDRSASTSDSSGFLYRRRPRAGGFDRLPGWFDHFPGGLDPLAAGMGPGPPWFDPYPHAGLPITDPPSEAGSEIRPPLLGEMFPGGLGGEWTRSWFHVKGTGCSINRW